MSPDNAPEMSALVLSVLDESLDLSAAEIDAMLVEAGFDPSDVGRRFEMLASQEIAKQRRLQARANYERVADLIRRTASGIGAGLRQDVAELKALLVAERTVSYQAVYRKEKSLEDLEDPESASVPEPTEEDREEILKDLMYLAEILREESDQT